MTKKDRFNETPVTDIPEALAYQEVKARYDAFRAANATFFSYLDGIQEELNQKMEAAAKVIRARGISCGDFEVYQYQVKYNPEELLQAVGRDKFLKVGGTMTVQTVYGVDKARVDASITSGEIPLDVADRVRIKAPRYHSPDPMRVL